MRRMHSASVMLPRDSCFLQVVESPVLVCCPQVAPQPIWIWSRNTGANENGPHGIDLLDRGPRALRPSPLCSESDAADEASVGGSSAGGGGGGCGHEDDEDDETAGNVGTGGREGASNKMLMPESVVSLSSSPSSFGAAIHPAPSAAGGGAAQWPP
jgi:hypothetical protein